MGFLISLILCKIKLKFLNKNKYVHIKTNNVYDVLLENVIECTNGREDTRYVLYCNDKNQWFCREFEEFHKKFKKK